MNLGLLGRPREQITRPPAMVLIEHVAAETLRDSLEFKSIPQEYRHLKIIGAFRTSAANVADTTRLRFNDDSGANYSFGRVGSLSDGSGGSTAQTSMRLGVIPDDSDASGFFSTHEITIADYANWVRHKTVVSVSGAFAAAGNQYAIVEKGAWSPTIAVAIAKITLFPDAGQWSPGCCATLYGL